MPHKRLLGLINSLQTAVYFSTGEVFEHESMDAPVDYTKTHFSNKESDHFFARLAD